MEQAGYKHFSHAHNLIIHQLPEGIDVSCSGCNSSGNGTVYVCWQCNFFLHEQCYRAARSLKHPSHPHHPLTLVPYPTYLSNSFYCNSCETIGTGISYSCADCEFDLHVQCAYSISRTKSFYKTHHQFQQLVPSSWNGQNVVQDSYVQYQTSQVPSMAQNLDPFVAYQTTSQNPIPSMPQNESSVASNHIPDATSHYHPPNPVTSSQDPSIDMNSQKPVATLQYPSIDQTEPSVSIPNDYPPNRIPHNGPSVSVSQYSSMTHTRPSSASIPANPPNPIPNNQDPSMPQKGPHVMSSHNPIPTSMPQTVSIPANPIPNNQDPSMPQNGPYITSSHNPIPSVPYPSMPQTVSISTNPIPNYQDPSMPHDTSSHNPVPSVPYPSMPQTVSIPTYPIPNNQDPLMPQNGPSVSIPDSSQNIIARTQFMTQTGQPVSIHAARPQEEEPSVSIHPSSQNPNTSAQYPSMSQTEPSVSSSFQDPSMPQNGLYVTSSHNPIPSVAYPSMPQTVSIPTNPIPNNQDPLMPQNGPSVLIPDSSQNIIAGAQFETQTGQSVSIPAARPQEKEPPVSIHPSSQNPKTSAQYPSMSQAGPSVSSGFPDPSMHQNEMKDKEIKHFSHSHNLFVLNFQEDEENEATCSACEDTLVGKGYPCVKTDCDFLLHESCFHLKREIQHKSHPEHPLTLLPLAPYNNKNGEFTCNACFSDGTGFTYNCSVCAFDLHIQCVSLPETVKRDDHEHVLKLFYSCPVEGEYPVCDVCHGNIQKDRWVYYCESCDYGTHLGCVDCEECEGDGNLENSILDAQAQLQRLQFQMEMSRQQAQFMASLGASLSNLV